LIVTGSADRESDPNRGEWTAFLAELGLLTLRASGTSMFPTIVPGDLLVIVPRGIKDVALGDIAVHRREGSMIAHRVVGRGEDIGGPFVCTQGDNRPGPRPGQVARRVSRYDGPCYESELVGVVEAIIRRGRRRPPAPPGTGRWCRARGRVFLLLWSLEQSIRRFGCRILGPLHQTRLYRRLGRLWLARVQPDFVYSLRVPLKGGVGSLTEEIRGPALELYRLPASTRGITYWSIEVSLRGRRIGWMTFDRLLPDAHDSVWRPAGSSVRACYRGLGLEEQLRSRAERIVQRSGARFPTGDDHE
jgi:hypothetical protein